MRERVCVCVRERERERERERDSERAVCLCLCLCPCPCVFACVPGAAGPRACQGPQGVTSPSHGGPCRVTDSDGRRFTPKIRGAGAPRGYAIRDAIRDEIWAWARHLGRATTPYGTRHMGRHTGRHMGRAHASRQLGASLVPAWCRLGPRRCRLGAGSVPACHGASSVPARSPAGRRQKRRIVPNREACNKIPNRDILKKDAIGVVKPAIKSKFVYYV